MTTDELIETLERLAGDAAAGERNPGAQAFGPSRYVEIRRDTLPQILSALKENKRMREALVETQANLELVEQVPFEDPDYGAEVEALGERIGYGALMTSASASWHARLKREGWSTGGAFVAGPCHGTVLRNLEIVRAALQPQGDAKP